MPATQPIDPPPPINYVLIDDENVPKLDLSSIEGKTVHVILLLGPKKTMLPVEQMLAMTGHAASTQLIRLEKAGKNALDFALAFYLGRAVQLHPGAYFHVVSKDTDYDSLIEHLKKQHIRINKHADASTLTFGQPRKPAEGPKAPAKPEAASKAPTPKPAPFAEILKRLRKQDDKAPKTRKKLISDIRSHLGKDATSAQADEVVLKLKNDGHVSFDENGKATYSLNR